MKRYASPDKGADERKSARPKVTVRPTDAELKLLHTRAESFGYKSLSKYLVERGLRDGAMLQTPERERVERLLFEVRKIGTNINQIARSLNENYKGYSPQRLDRAMREVERVMREIAGEFKG